MAGAVSRLWSTVTSTWSEYWYGSNGNAHVAVKEDYRGLYPNTYYLAFLGSAGTNDNDLVYTSPDVSAYNTHMFECTAGTIDLEVTMDGTNWQTTNPPAVLLHDATAVGTYSLTIAANKIGILKMKCKGVRVRQNGATPSNCRGAHVVA